MIFRGNKPCFIQDFPPYAVIQLSKENMFGSSCTLSLHKTGIQSCKAHSPFLHALHPLFTRHRSCTLKPTRNKNQSQNLLLRRQRALSIMKLVLETPRLLTSEHKEQSPHPKYLPSGSTTREFIAGGGFSMNTPGEEHVYKQITPAIFSRSVSGMLFICLFIYSTRK